MRQYENELLTNEVEHKIGMIKTFYSGAEGADEFIEMYNEYTNDGCSVYEIKLFIEDLTLFLEGMEI